MSHRRLRAVLLCIRDARAAELLRSLLTDREIEQTRMAEMRREIRELRLMVRRLCCAADIAEFRID